MNIVVILVYTDQDSDLPNYVLLVHGIDNPVKLDHEVQEWRDTHEYDEDTADEYILEQLGYTVEVVPYMYSTPYEGLCQG